MSYSQREISILVSRQMSLLVVDGTQSLKHPRPLYHRKSCLVSTKDYTKTYISISPLYIFSKEYRTTKQLPFAKWTSKQTNTVRSMETLLKSCSAKVYRAWANESPTKQRLPPILSFDDRRRIHPFSTVESIDIWCGAWINHELSTTSYELQKLLNKET
jgi:hypothetical protein